MMIESPYRSKVRNCYLTQGDLDAISAALRERWPATRFLPESHSRRYRPDEGVPPLPADIAVPYLDRLRPVDGEARIVSWVEPEGWEPRWHWRWAWGDPTKGGSYRIANEPPFKVMWLLPETRSTRLRGGIGNIQIQQGRVEGYFLAFEKEREAFLRQVWRLLDRFMTNREPMVTWVHWRGRFSDPVRAPTDWVGHDALRWLREDPGHSLDGSMFLAPEPGGDEAKARAAKMAREP